MLDSNPSSSVLTGSGDGERLLNPTHDSTSQRPSATHNSDEIENDEDMQKQFYGSGAIKGGDDEVDENGVRVNVSRLSSYCY